MSCSLLQWSFRAYEKVLSTGVVKQWAEEHQLIINYWEWLALPGQKVAVALVEDQERAQLQAAMF